MTYAPQDDEVRAAAARNAALEMKARERQQRLDVQAVFATVEGRRLLAAFLRDAGADDSAFRLDPIAMAHAVAFQDAGHWWLNLIRRWCPEREALMRKESREAAPSASQDHDR